MSFGEYVNVGRFIQKASMVDPIVIFNHVHLRRKQLKKILQDTRRRTTEAWAKRPQKWASSEARSLSATSYVFPRFTSLILRQL
jgi:predicted HAD superfamily Cof-like phosphohydrolase